MLPGYEYDTTEGADKRVSLESRNGEYVTGDIIVKSNMKPFSRNFHPPTVTSSVLDSNVRIKSS
jgi:hypothetical protein